MTEKDLEKDNENIKTGAFVRIDRDARLGIFNNSGIELSIDQIDISDVVMLVICKKYSKNMIDLLLLHPTLGLVWGFQRDVINIIDISNPKYKNGRTTLYF